MLSRRIGLSRAKEIIFTARRVTAEEAVELGAVTKVVAREELDAQALALADEICKASPVATRAAKRALDASTGLPVEDGMEAENDAWKTVIGSEDRVEGIAAFNEKRSPAWRNR